MVSDQPAVIPLLSLNHSAGEHNMRDLETKHRVGPFETDADVEWVRVRDGGPAGSAARSGPIVRFTSPEGSIALSNFDTFS